HHYLRAWPTNLVLPNAPHDRGRLEQCCILAWLAFRVRRLQRLTMDDPILVDASVAVMVSLVIRENKNTFRRLSGSPKLCWPSVVEALASCPQLEQLDMTG